MEALGTDREEDGKTSTGPRPPRLELRLSAKLESISVRRGVALLNLSTDGAMIESEVLPPAGADIILKCGVIDVIGVVKWVRRHRCGIRFDEPIDYALVTRYRDASRSLAAMEHTPAALRAAREWASGL